MRIIQIIFIFFAFIPCYAQYNCNCDYKTSDTLFYKRMLRLENKELAEVAKTRTEVVKDTLNLDSLVYNYYENGNIYTRLPYKDGKLCGFYEQYFSNGQLAYRNYFINGKSIDGYYFFYDIDGSIREEGRLKNDHYIGDRIIYVFREPFKKYTYSRKGKLLRVKAWNEIKNRWEKTGFNMEIIEIANQKYEFID